MTAPDSTAPIGPAPISTPTITTAVITIVRGRLDHLERQAWGLARQTDPAFVWVVVRMGGPDVRDITDASGLRVVIVDLDVGPEEPLPLAAARNAGVAAMPACSTAVLLDVDVIPSPTLVADYVDAVRTTEGVVAGPVTYLPPGIPQTRADLDSLQGAGAPHSARPVPAPGVLLASTRWELLWTLSLALPTQLFARAGGFDERYVGYGGEDTDFAMRLQASGASLHWLGGAWGYHQHHDDVGSRDKVEDVVRNAALFRRTWGWWPMTGWLQRLADDDLIVWDPDGDTAHVV